MPHTLIIGSGAAGLNAAIQLHARGVTDLLVLTEGLTMGTSINTGSDKQTYYKLGLAGDEPDSPMALARVLHAGGGVHGDLALVEAALSARAFFHLVEAGVPFPCDGFGQYAGYKTDHDPARRATSIGPYTSREMCRALIRRLQALAIPVREHVNVVELLTVCENGGPRAAGAVFVTREGAFETVLADNVVFATGGPGGLYAASVYPPVHTGGIGLALAAGATARNLPESQFGLASIRFRWNVSGTYMQCVPRFISTAADGVSDVRAFLADAIPDPGRLHTLIFLKGYQWPFDVRKASGGSSLIDLLVHRETVERGRRVFLDFRENPAGFSLAALAAEAREYLEKSGATQDAPYRRLEAMNPGAIALYRDHGITLDAEPLEIAVCAQHNNGGLAANAWWESASLSHLFPVGEVNGSHGVARPGGSALNAGQVGGFRAADYIAHVHPTETLDRTAAAAAAADALNRWRAWAALARGATRSWRDERAELQARMTRAGAHVRDGGRVQTALAEAGTQHRRIQVSGCGWETPRDLAEACRNRALALAACAYLSAIAAALRDGVGSRGSAVVLDPAGTPIDPVLDAGWRMMPENPAFRERVLLTQSDGDGGFTHRWAPCRPIPESDLWFETTWRDFREGRIYAEGLARGEKAESRKKGKKGEKKEKGVVFECEVW